MLTGLAFYGGLSFFYIFSPASHQLRSGRWPLRNGERFVTVNLAGRNFVSMTDFNAEEIGHVLRTAERLKADHYGDGDRPLLANKTLAMIFQKPSLRTRVSFEAGMTRLGGHAVYLAPNDIKLGARETTEDIALVLSRYADLIMARTFGHDIVVDLAKHTSE